MKYYKCVKAWSRHGVGTTINEWEYTKLPINIKSGHFQEQVDQTSPNVPLPTPQTTVWMEGSKPVGFGSPLIDGDKVQFSVRASPTDTEVTVSSNVVEYTTAKMTDTTTSTATNYPAGTTIEPPLTTFSSGNKFKDKLKSSKNEDNI